MKQLTKIFQALLGIAALICTSLIAFGRLTWRTITNGWKKRSKGFRRLMKVVLILFVVGFVALRIYSYFDYNYGRRYWDNKRLSSSVMVHSFRDNTYRVYNKVAQEYTTKKVGWVSTASENDSLAVYAMPGKRGFLNINTGEIVIDAEKNAYTKAWVFSDGLAAVMKEGKIGFVNAENEVVIPFQYDYSDKCRIWDCGYLFHKGYCLMTDKDGNFGLIDTEGKWVVEPTYDEVWAPHESGYRIVVDDGKHGVLDAQCQVVYPTEYVYIDILSDGFVLNVAGKKWKENFHGEVIEPFLFDATYYLNYPIGYDDCGSIEYAFADYAKYEIMNHYGIMNRITGKPITPAIYIDINMLSKDLFEVQDAENSDWRLLGGDGNPKL